MSGPAHEAPHDLGSLGAVLSACPVPMAVNDEAQNILFLNAEFTRVFGYTREDCPNLECWWPLAYPDPEYRRWVHAEWDRRLRDAEATGALLEPMEVRVHARDGSTRAVMSSASPLGPAYPAMHLVVLYDVTERVRMHDDLVASRRVLQSIIDTLPVRVFWKDRNLFYLGCNTAFARDAGKQTPAEVVGRDDSQLAWCEQAELYRADDRAVMASGQAKLGYEEPQTTPTGEKIWLRTSKLPLRDESGRTTGVLGIYEDITRQKAAEEKLFVAALVFQHSSEGMLVTDAENRIVLCNPAFTRLTGYSLEEVVGRDPKFLQSGRQGAEFYRQLWQELLANGHWQGEIWNRRKNGEAYAQSMMVNTIRQTDGSVYRYVALFSDITDKKLSDELIWMQANFDPLTRLPNRRMFRDRLEQELKKAHRARSPLALLFIDLDRFKDINDTLGHDRGDELLVEVARRISSCVREADTVARMGGDEFTVILPRLADSSNVERVAMCIIEALARPVQLGNEVVYISASIGITLYPDDSEDIESLLRNADQAMYVAKNSGRNRFSYFTSAMQEAAQRRMHLVTDLREALHTGQLELYYQPIVELSSDRVSKAEALLRWKHPLIGYVSPAEFIPLAEESGLIHPIGEWVFQQALWQVQRWRAEFGEDFQISVNMSALQFRTAPGSVNWTAYLAAAGLPGRSVVIEITESAMLDASEAVMGRLIEFRDANIQVAIDDFGTGYSSLSYLKKLDIDYLKIDQSFIRGLVTDGSDHALTEAMIVMAHKLGILVVAEGVETEAQRDALRSIGCDFGQGYLFARPLPASAFEALLRQRLRPDQGSSSSTTGA